MKHIRALKGRNNGCVIAALQALVSNSPGNQGRRASRLPLAFILRAVGADLALLVQSLIEDFER